MPLCFYRHVFLKSTISSNKKGWNQGLKPYFQEMNKAEHGSWEKDDSAALFFSEP